MESAIIINAEGSHFMILRHSDVTVKQGWPGVYVYVLPQWSV